MINGIKITITVYSLNSKITDFLKKEPVIKMNKFLVFGY